MPTFVWREILTISVSEMSRTAAIDCCREFDMITAIYTTYAEQTSEADILSVVHAPAIIKVNGDIFSSGERLIEVPDDQPFKLVLPLTRESFLALPYSLTAAWINAALKSNGWWIDSLLKVYSLAPKNNLEPKSGNGLLNELIAVPLMITTIGA